MYEQVPADGIHEIVIVAGIVAKYDDRYHYTPQYRRNERSVNLIQSGFSVQIEISTRQQVGYKPSCGYYQKNIYQIACMQQTKSLGIGNACKKMLSVHPKA
jgi:hypothetical protein